MARRAKDRQQPSKEFAYGSQTPAERGTIWFHFDFTFAEYSPIKPISDNLTMTGHSSAFCAGLLTFHSFFNWPSSKAQSGIV
jgi:hypothetical protein